nr:DNA repair exonuclease [Neobacillus sp. Marseille-Q6967]
MKQISFLHAADLHLDSPMVGLKHFPGNILSRLRESTFTALEKLTKAAIDLQVDFVILAGDLFDGEDRSLRAQSRFRSEMQILEQKGIPVFVIHGNHDHLNGSWVHLDMPSNVYFFDSKVEVKEFVTKRGEMVHLYGFSYPERQVYDRKIEDYLKKEPADFHIGILHGNEGGRADHDNYAPFSVKELLEKQFDYWALGHIHKRAVLAETPPVVYPGNIQGRNRKESGIKGCYHVTLTELEACLEFVETSDVVWEEIFIDASGANRFQDILSLCQQEIERLRKEQSGILLTLNLENVHLENQREKRTLDIELLDVLLDDENEEESFVWISDLRVQYSQEFDRESLKAEANFYEELFKTFDGIDHVDDALSSFYQHALARKHLPSLTKEEQKDLLKKAEKLLVNLLH